MTQTTRDPRARNASVNVVTHNTSVTKLDIRDPKKLGCWSKCHKIHHEIQTCECYDVNHEELQKPGVPVKT